MQWLRIEVSIFYVNLAVLIGFLVRATLVRDIRDMKKRITFENQDIIDGIADKIPRFGKDLGKEIGHDIQLTLLKEDDAASVQRNLEIISEY